MNELAVYESLLAEVRNLKARRQASIAKAKTIQAESAKIELASTASREENTGREGFAPFDHHENLGWAITITGIAGIVDVWGGSIAFGSLTTYASKFVVAFADVEITSNPGYIYLYPDTMLGGVAIGVAADLELPEGEARVFLGKVTLTGGDVTEIEQWVNGQVLLPGWEWCNFGGLTQCEASYGLSAPVPCPGDHLHNYVWGYGEPSPVDGKWMNFVCGESCSNCVEEPCEYC